MTEVRQVRRYTVVLTPDPEEGGYGVLVPALPGCFSQGGTVDEALANVREAIQLHLEGIEEDGEPAPEDVTPLLALVPVPTPHTVAAAAAT
ncbi:MAG: type II toxin-antitoxin system HicB family antitoxin [Chloroflexi bacterium]|nr:type II toxin-antitoxin system HicB family antitoxin [Chloroflexota bacterium]